MQCSIGSEPVNERRADLRPCLHAMIGGSRKPYAYHCRLTIVLRRPRLPVRQGKRIRCTSLRGIALGEVLLQRYSGTTCRSCRQSGDVAATPGQMKSSCNPQMQACDGGCHNDRPCPKIARDNVAVAKRLAVLVQPCQAYSRMRGHSCHVSGSWWPVAVVWRSTWRRSTAGHVECMCLLLSRFRCYTTRAEDFELREFARPSLSSSPSLRRTRWQTVEQPVGVRMSRADTNPSLSRTWLGLCNPLHLRVALGGKRPSSSRRPLRRLSNA